MPDGCRQAFPGLDSASGSTEPAEVLALQRRSETRRRQGESVQLPDEPMRCLANAILAQARETAAAII
jgi:hypothetical protein